MQTLRTRPGTPSPLGATWDGPGTNFALYSESATGIELCLFDEGAAEIRIPMRQKTEFVWHVYVEGIGPGQQYGFRVDGPWEPQNGLRFNSHNVLLDPYAKGLSGVEDWSKGAFSYDVLHPERDLVKNENDQLGAPRGVVIDPAFDWGDDAPPNIPLRKSIIYEAHVKGLTARHPSIAPELRGTYLGIASDPIIRHLRELGVTTIELLPTHGFVDDQFLLERGLRNYWGYNSIAFFAPDVRYRAGNHVTSEVHQFKRMVKSLHAAGIEVILDVVYNHTAEGNHQGPTLSFRGIDNPTYYRLVADAPRFYFDYTGTGNTLNVVHPQTLRLVMDSLRYWVEEMHVDGFRFDLASTLARGLYEVDRLSSFFTVIHQDPVISRVKLIAEPWDVGAGGYQVGRFPVKWAEWNGKYRDTMRAFWRGDGGKAAELGYRLTGSSDLYRHGGRSPSSSINFITAHDGFTLRDLVTYNGKHNDANGEENRDGADDNVSSNCGVEGETDDPSVTSLRLRQIRNMLSTLLLSQGTPMICGGDEIGRTQNGNNNAYCQDNEISWHDWNLDDDRKAILAFTKSVIRLRHDHPLIQRASFFEGREVRGLGLSDVVWFRHDGETMNDEDWANPGTSSLGVFSAGSGLDPVDEEGRSQIDDDLLLVLNASGTDLEFHLPRFVDRGSAVPWTLLLDTTVVQPSREQVEPDGRTTLVARSLKLFGRRAVGAGGLQATYGAATSTYRLQLRREFGFKSAESIVAYLDDLGIGGIYTSPYLRAVRGSTHGYDTVDYSSLNPEIGTTAEHVAFTSAMAARKMKHIVDFVPNHIGIGSGENAWWLDVLEHGPSSMFAPYFDIEWEPPATALHGKVLLPVLGRQFGQEVDEGKLSVRRDHGSLWVNYFERRFPASPRSYIAILERAVSEAALATDTQEGQELASILDALRNLPSSRVTDTKERAERARETAVIKRRIDALTASNAEIAQAIDDAVESISASSDRLERFLSDQNYRLSYWRVATEEINYRRFFDVNELAALRMEDAEVFAAAHGLVLDWIAKGVVTGLRLDHTDGLYDPEGYFQSLQASVRDALHRGNLPTTAPIYAIAEKILGSNEEIPGGWAISGTTGYDYLAAVNGLWVDRTAEQQMTKIYGGYSGARTDYSSLVYQAKRDVMDGSFSSEIHVLAHELKGIAEQSRRGRDFTLPALVRVIKETIAAFPIYRTYVRPDGSRQKNDESHIRTAIDLAKQTNPMIDSSIFDFMADALMLVDRNDATTHFAMRFQQLSGPIMAKGVEDTAFYRYQRLTSLNEVGCDTERFGSTIDEFHEHNIATLARWPLSMTTTTTHDTKRSEDVRSRLSVLSEVPDEWVKLVSTLDEIAFGSQGKRVDAISKNDVYLFYQTVVGVYPFEGLKSDEDRASFADRLTSFMHKASREAKLYTSWTTPNERYDDAIEDWVRHALASPDFVKTIEAFVQKIVPYGVTNSLAQVALRLASPGVPDIYQGCESWCLALVDPDNRRPVDFDARRADLAAIRKLGAPSPKIARDLLDRFANGRVKTFLTTTCLRMRRELPALFLEGKYVPIACSEHAIAFERSHGPQRLVCVVPRLSRKLTAGATPWPIGEVWRADTLKLSQAGKFQNAFTGERIEGDTLPLASIFATFPVAWLVAQGS